MASRATRRDTGMIHGRTQKAGGVNVARIARSSRDPGERNRNMGRRLWGTT